MPNTSAARFCGHSGCENGTRPRPISAASQSPQCSASASDRSMRAAAGSSWQRIASQIGGGNRHCSASRAPSSGAPKPNTSRSTSEKPRFSLRAVT